ncbi:hypothetical protein KY290_001763 [Solanum tuberosum]|uniref:Uncharacterized protein n=1 Tax=Solanum tuberosum TaxID=4113 RepID=A0ABQ7WNN8_SOLTU|nr:hypothetical protein KY290_001763 [Solanum tuberosum]
MIDGVKLAGAPVVMGQSWSTDSEEARSSLFSAKGGTVAELSGSVVGAMVVKYNITSRACLFFLSVVN